jgi:hypothetical protein
VTLVFDEKGFYIRLADRLLDEVPWHQKIRRRGHGLCVCLNNLSKGLDPGTYAQIAHVPVRAGLLMLGFPRPLAETLGAATAFGIKKALEGLPPAHLAKALRVLIPLVCPELGTCPARGDVLKTYAAPQLAEQLKALATQV